MPGTKDTEKQISRRSFLQLGLAGVCTAALLFLSACGGDDDDDGDDGDDD